MSIKIDVASDLHVDAWLRSAMADDTGKRQWEGEPHNSPFIHIDWEWYKNEGSRILVIAGDTANTIDLTATVVRQAASVYEHVVFVDGNHEHYNGSGTVASNMDDLRASIAAIPNATYLDGTTSFKVDNLLIVGATGWYDWKAYEDQHISHATAKQAWYRFSNDSHVPAYGKLGNPEQIAILQSTQIAETVRTVADDDTVENILVVTHMSPRADLMEWKEGNVVWNTLTPSYVNTSLAHVREADSKNKITHWVYGHTHFRKTIELDGITYVNNARGYPRENDPFSLKQIEVGAKSVK